MIKKNSSFAFTILTLLSLFFASCRSARFLDKDTNLVTSIHIQGVDADLKESSSAYISNEIRPNSRLNLFIYNLFNTKKGKYKKTKIRNVGEPPRILDTAFVELSNTQIQRYLYSQGYFNAEVKPEVTVKKKRASITFHIDAGEPYLIRKIERQFADSALGHTFKKELEAKSVLKSGQKYSSNDLMQEREQLYTLLRNRGYFTYIRQYMRVAVDTTVAAHQADLKIMVDNPIEQARHITYEIDSVYIQVKNPEHITQTKKKGHSFSQDQINFFDETGRYRLKPILRYAYLKPGDPYSMAKETLSYDRLYELNGFRTIKIHYTASDSGKLHMNYELVPRPAMGNQVEGEYTFSSGLNGINVGNTFSHRNIFGGSEQLEVKLRYGVLFDPKLGGSIGNRIFNNDFQIGVNLVFPRLMLPFGWTGTAKSGLPKTTLSSNLQIFDQDKTYSNRYSSNTLNYSWFETSNKMHSFTPIVLEYRLGRLNQDFANDLIEKGYQLYVESNNREYFGLGTQYAFTYNANKLLRTEDFTYFKGSIDLSGSVLDAISRVIQLKENQQGEKMVFGVPYLQYAKTEIDFRWYKNFGGSRQFVFRFNPGIAIPYGNNSRLLIFEKSFFGGGMNGIRAWQARTLGPGNYNRAGLDESLRLNFRNLDQLGEIKIEGNMEYRFKIINNFLGAKLKGATFVDFGNIWRLKENELNPGGEFKFNRFLGQFALGTGLGFRFDSGYFIIRLDAGIKVKDPQFEGANQWVIKHLFDQKEFKEAYFESHRPDRYNFIQYNFGIGLPF